LQIPVATFHELRHRISRFHIGSRTIPGDQQVWKPALRFMVATHDLKIIEASQKHLVFRSHCT
jgi:hypothetical protein